MNRGVETHARTTVAGVKLRREKDVWIADDLGGEKWCFGESVKGRRWQGFTWDHVTGTGLHRTLRAAIEWVREHRDEWQAKLRVRREAGTRMVDPS